MGMIMRSSPKATEAMFMCIADVYESTASLLGFCSKRHDQSSNFAYCFCWSFGINHLPGELMF